MSDLDYEDERLQEAVEAAIKLERAKVRPAPPSDLDAFRAMLERAGVPFNVDDDGGPVAGMKRALIPDEAAHVLAIQGSATEALFLFSKDGNLIEVDVDE